MGIFDKIKKLLGIGSQKDLIKLKVRCNKCQEEIDSVFRKNYDFQPTYGAEEYDYSIQKELVCPNCYDSINLSLELDKNLNILSQEISGGQIINPTEEEK
ncbi:hypothetical protein [Halanaerobacter jeridensis]|uniref:Zn finger protein HypA/HybF involved in hydrogenase expression n=1 Tax=Halanaerobacter jeridensis TaxID=706427 RepID=A0A938XS40_9FIRM|nr:hypothetical protein [Halanaerobacter jeridensis]MBM7555814.1 Zn finger protein HypA/HybF involved in hydrogenase expression [Halanaerobacter jeridensis]